MKGRVEGGLENTERERERERARVDLYEEYVSTHNWLSRIYYNYIFAPHQLFLFIVFTLIVEGGKNKPIFSILKIQYTKFQILATMHKLDGIISYNRW